MSVEDVTPPPALPDEGLDLAGRVERSLLGRPASMGRREVSEGAGVEPLTARRFWHAMGFQNVDDDDAMFTEADLQALQRVARLIGEGRVSEELALGMTRAFARTADRLAVWQTQLVAESLTSPFSEELEGRDSRSVPEPRVAADAAQLLVSISDDIEPLLVYVWRRHLTNAISRMGERTLRRLLIIGSSAVVLAASKRGSGKRIRFIKWQLDFFVFDF